MQIYGIIILTNHKKESFPTYQNELFVPEALVFHRLEKQAPFCFINKAIKYVEYPPTGFSVNMTKLFKENPQGYYTYCLEFINFFKPPLKQRIRHIAAVGVFGKINKLSHAKNIKNIKKISDKTLYLLLIPAIIFYKI
ncbi:MAG: hypothetical protein ACRC6X_04755 [Culicoidibacterales bacterium]